MPRKKPTIKLAVYGKYDINPENAVELYTESKAQNKFYIKPPYWDIAREGFELKAIENERDYEDFKCQQSRMREDAILKGKHNEKRIQEMYKAQDELRQTFISANNFIKECEEKEINATRKIQMEQKLQEEIKTEIDKLSNDYKILKEFEQVLAATAQEFKPYEDVMIQVVAESDIFKSVKDMMDRCDALMIAQVEISEMDRQKVNEIEEMRQKMVTATNDAALATMGLNNKLADLEKSYEEAQNAALKWENILEMTKNFIADNELTTFRLIDSIRHMYNMLATRNREEKKIIGDNYERMLDYIKNELEILQEVVKIANRRIAKDQQSMVNENGSRK